VKKQFNNNKKNSGQKIRTGDIVVAVFVVYRCAFDASTLHAASLGMIPLVSGGDRHFQSFFFFVERRAR
jgi:hypothetical protein